MAVSNAHCLSNRDVENVATEVVHELGYEALKPEQLQVVVGVWRERDVFAVCCPLALEKTLFCLPAIITFRGNGLHSRGTDR